MTSKKTIGIGIAGCGRIADLQYHGYHEHPHAKILGVCDPDRKRAERLAKICQSAKIYTDFNQLLSDRKVQAVEILTPHHLHASQAIASLKAGKHVSLQKPPTLTLKEFDSIAEAAKKSKRTIRIFENYMHYPPHLKAKSLIKKGVIGDPISIRMKIAIGPKKYGWALEPKTEAWRQDPLLCGGGPITFDHGYHCFSMARFFIPKEIKRVHAFIHYKDLSKTSWTDGPALISWQYVGNPPRYGSWEVIDSKKMQVRSKYYSCDERMEIHGTQGIIWINCCTGRLLDEPSLVIYKDGETKAIHHINTDWSESFRLGSIDFIDALLCNKQPAQDLNDARQTLAFALAVIKSAKESREVNIKEILNH